MILLYTAIFEKRRYLVAAFAVSLACAMLRYRLLKVSSVYYLQTRHTYHARNLMLIEKGLETLTPFCAGVHFIIVKFAMSFI